MSYQKAMRHHNNPRKWKMTPARRRGNRLIFGVPTTEKSCKEVTKEQPMSDTLQEGESGTTTVDYCDECKGRPHAPWCSLHESDKEVEGSFQQSRTAKYPAKVLAELTAAGELNNEQYQRLRRETVDSEHQPAARGGGEGERFGFVVFTGRHKILDYHKPDGQQVATADDEDSARLIVRALNQHQALVAERKRLLKTLQCVLQSLQCGGFAPAGDVRALAQYLESEIIAIEQRSTSE